MSSRAPPPRGWPSLVFGCLRGTHFAETQTHARVTRGSQSHTVRVRRWNVHIKAFRPSDSQPIQEGGASSGQTQSGSASAQTQHISLSDAARLESTMGPRTVRAKHLPLALQRRYGHEAGALQPTEVHSVRRVFDEAPARAESMPESFPRMLPQRPGNHGASAASRIADVLAMAQAAVRKEKQRVSSTPAPTTVYGHGARGKIQGSSSQRHRQVAPTSGRRARSAGAGNQQGTATSPFVTSGREQAGKVGYNCLRTGAASGSKGPACYEPRWRSLRPHSASAALDRCYASAGRHMGAVVNQAQGLKQASQLGKLPRAPQANVEAESSRSSNSESVMAHNYNGVAPRFSVAGTALGGMKVSPVHPKSQKVFQHERATNSACFKAIPRTAQMGGYAHAQEPMTAESIGPGSYKSSLHRSGLSGRCIHSASSKPDRRSCSPAWRNVQPQNYGLPQLRRNQLSPGPTSYSVERSFAAASARGPDFTRLTPRPGSAPPLRRCEEPDIVPCDAKSEFHATRTDLPVVEEGTDSKHTVQRGLAGLQPACSPSSHGTFKFAAVTDMLEAEDFIYDDEEDAEDGELGYLDTYHHQQQVTHEHTTHRGNHGLIDAVDGAKSAAEIEAALHDQQVTEQHRQQHKGIEDCLQECTSNDLQSGQTMSSATRPVSARPPSGRPLSGRPKSALPPSGRPLSGRPGSERPRSSQDGYRQRRKGFKAQAPEIEDSLPEGSDEEGISDDVDSVQDNVARGPCDVTGPASTAVPRIVASICIQDGEQKGGENSHLVSRPVSAGAVSTSLHTPWKHSNSSCAGLHSGWSAPSYHSCTDQSPASSCQLQQQLGASSSIKKRVVLIREPQLSNRVRRPSKSAHVSREARSAGGSSRTSRPATACAPSNAHKCGSPSVTAWRGDTPAVVERPISAFSNPDMAQECMRLERQVNRRPQGRAVTAHPQLRSHQSGTSAHTAGILNRPQSACSPGQMHYSRLWAPGRLRKARERQAALSTHATYGQTSFHQTQKAASQPGKKENQCIQANRPKHSTMQDADSTIRSQSRGESNGITISKSTRQQELSGQRLMGVSGIVKPVSAGVVLANDVFYDASVTAPSHRRRTPACSLPPCRYELRKRQILQAKVSTIDVQRRIHRLQTNER